jgi:DNA modification methylase
LGSFASNQKREGDRIMDGHRTRPESARPSRPGTPSDVIEPDDGAPAQGRDLAIPRPMPLIIEDVPIDALHPDPANPRRISDPMLDALEASVGAFGVVQPILARRSDGVVIGGHQRLIAARMRGLLTVPVIYLDVTVEQSRLLNLALNKIGGTWHESLLARLLADLSSTQGIDLRLSGFAEDEIQTYLRSLQAREKREQLEDFDLDEALETATRTRRTRPGDLWKLGDHILLCGDATNADDIARLLGSRRASMAFTDPPYNVGLGDHGGHQRGTRRRRMANDALDPLDFEEFVRAWAHNLLAAVDGALYIFMSTKEWPTVSRILAEEGGHWSDTLIWAKDRFTLGRADYQRAYEPIWFGWREGAERFWCGDRDQSDVWEIARLADAPLHPVMKPVPLIERAISNSSREGDLILDLFVGSGSTLIACERTARVGAGIELDPRYVDVAVGRWERFSGQTGVVAHA